MSICKDNWGEVKLLVLISDFLMIIEIQVGSALWERP